MGSKLKLAPDRLDLICILAEETRREMIGEQAHDRRAAGADRVAITSAYRTIAVGDRNDWRFLTDKALDCISAQYFRR